MSSIINEIGNNPEKGVIAKFEQGAFGLSKAEARAFEMMAAGFNRPTTAALFSRQLKTIDSHMDAVYSKLGVHSVAEAIALACSEGALTFEAVARSVRNLLLVGFMVSTGAQLFADEPIQMRRLRLPQASSVRVNQRGFVA